MLSKDIWESWSDWILHFLNSINTSFGQVLQVLSHPGLCLRYACYIDIDLKPDTAIMDLKHSLMRIQLVGLDPLVFMDINPRAFCFDES